MQFAIRLRCPHARQAWDRRSVSAWSSEDENPLDIGGWSHDAVH